jgi:putative aminopeptidase FrvX
MAVPDLLRRLLEAAGPPGLETAPAQVWREAAAPFAEVTGDAMGSSLARVAGTGEAPLLALFGHIDEIALVVTHVDDSGFAYVRGLGGWNAQVLLGQRLEVLTRDGPVAAVVAARRDPGKADEKKRVELEDLHLDLGAHDGEETRGLVRVGDAAVIAAAPLELRNGRIASRALDDRLGAYVVLEVARRVADGGGAPGPVAAVASVQEEVGDYIGARTTAYGLEPALAVAVDVTPVTDAPGGDPKEEGEKKVGGGPVLTRGPGLDAGLFDRLTETAEAEGIPYQVEVSRGRSHTDADGVAVSRTGVPTAVVSIPTRYLHTPVELCDLADVEACVRLLVAFARRADLP